VGVNPDAGPQSGNIDLVGNTYSEKPDSNRTVDFSG
jgi:hypothetical protein